MQSPTPAAEGAGIDARYEAWARHDAVLRTCIQAGMGPREIIVHLCEYLEATRKLLDKLNASLIRPFTVTDVDREYREANEMLSAIAAENPVRGLLQPHQLPNGAAAMCPACGEKGQDLPYVPDEDGNNRCCARCAYRWKASDRINDLLNRGRAALRLAGTLTPFNCGACDHPMAMFVKSTTRPDPARPQYTLISFKMRNAVRCVKCQHLGQYLCYDLFIFTRYEGPITHPSQMGDQGMTPARNRLPDDIYI